MEPQQQPTDGPTTTAQRTELPDTERYHHDSGAATTGTTASMPLAHVPGVMGATPQTVRMLEVIAREFRASRTTRQNHFIIGLIAPDGADLTGLGVHLIGLLNSARPDVESSKPRADRVAIIPSLQIAESRLNNLAPNERHPTRCECKILHRFHLNEPLPATPELRLVNLLDAISQTEHLQRITLIHTETQAHWDKLMESANFVADRIRHVIELQIPRSDEVAEEIRVQLKRKGIKGYCADELESLVQAADGAVKQRGVHLSDVISSQLIGGHEDHQVDLHRIASGFDVALGTPTDPIRRFIGFDAVNDELDGIVELARNRHVLGDSGLHCVFLGNPGSGKTEAARALGLRLHRAGVCARPHVEAVTRADLVGEYIGTTAPRVQRACQRARGGVLFIDEAYSLNNGPGDSALHKDYGHEALAELVLQMENMRDELVVILAGYPEPMAEMIKLNPGLESRITFRVDFPDLSATELLDVFKLYLEARNLTATPSAMQAVEDYLHHHHAGVNFGNARGVRRVLANMLTSAARRATTSHSIVLEADDLSGLAEAAETPEPVPSIGFGRYL